MTMFSDPGRRKVSMMRVIAFMGACLGMVMGLAGVVAMFLDASAAGTAMATGMGCFTSGSIAKAMQTKWEPKSD